MANVEDAVQRRQFVLQSEFTEAFDRELSSQSGFTAIMREVKNLLSDGKTVQNALTHGGKTGRAIGKEARERSGELSGLGLKAGSLSADFEWDATAGKKVYTMKLEGLYDIVRALISKVFLKQPD